MSNKILKGYSNVASGSSYVEPLYSIPIVEPSTFSVGLPDEKAKRSLRRHETFGGSHRWRRNERPGMSGKRHDYTLSIEMKYRTKVVRKFNIGGYGIEETEETELIIKGEEVPFTEENADEEYNEPNESFVPIKGKVRKTPTFKGYEERTSVAARPFSSLSIEERRPLFGDDEEDPHTQLLLYGRYGELRLDIPIDETDPDTHDFEHDISHERD